jgi:hypothetical protein
VDGGEVKIGETHCCCCAAAAAAAAVAVAAAAVDISLVGFAFASLLLNGEDQNNETEVRADNSLHLIESDQR